MDRMERIMATSDPTALASQVHRRAILTLQVMGQLLTQQPSGLNLQQRAQWVFKSRAAAAALDAAAAQLRQTPPQEANYWLACIQQTLTDAADAACSDDQFQARLAERLAETLKRVNGNHRSTTESGAIEQGGQTPALPAPRE